MPLQPNQVAVAKDTNAVPSPQFWDPGASSGNGNYSYAYGYTALGEAFASAAYITPARSSGYVSGQNIKATAGVYFGIKGVYKGTTTAWIMAFDSNGIPGNGTAALSLLLAIISVSAAVGGVDTNWFDSSSGRPYKFANGLYIALSTTGTQFTASGNTDIQFITDYF